MWCVFVFLHCCLCILSNLQVCLEVSVVSAIWWQLLCSRSCICYVPLQFPFSNYFPHSQSFQIMQTAQLAPLLGGGITFYLGIIDQGSETQTAPFNCQQFWQLLLTVGNFDSFPQLLTTLTSSSQLWHLSHSVFFF